MNEGGGLQRVSSRLSGRLLLRKPAQLIVDDRPQLPLCLGIFLASVGQELRTWVGVWLRHGDFPPDT